MRRRASNSTAAAELQPPELHILCSPLNRSRSQRSLHNRARLQRGKAVVGTEDRPTPQSFCQAGAP